eukprot:Blabericola_migrator_1__10428@NODE_58_length_15904_cov_68_205342_g53_i0_p2_GENE_NODE_58_length_15904_cov_68_205342_g53_i0NODE_58_length_15904_cov_68_205342_g53_i0_p2_ORF_typecomplete_len379_score53_40TFIIF_beta/PF02270_15/0_00021TFIIF_beta_N/PF17683_1/0_025_NODE_58_length_15904_cov_68_205342_g53_i0921910355
MDPTGYGVMPPHMGYQLPDTSMMHMPPGMMPPHMAPSPMMAHPMRYAVPPTPYPPDTSSVVSTAPQTPKAASEPSPSRSLKSKIEADIGNDSDPAVIAVREAEAVLIKVPDFVSERWLSEKPGTVLGVVTVRSKRPAIYFPRKLEMPVKAVHSNFKPINAVEARDSSECVLSAVGAGPHRAWPVNTTGRVEGSITKQLAFLPDITDPGYRAFMESRSSKSKVDTAASTSAVKKTPIVLSAEESAKLHQRMLEDVGEAGTSRRLFHYYGAGGEGGGGSDDDLDSTSGVGAQEGGGGGRTFGRQKKRRITQLTVEEGQAKLFKFFESNSNQPANMKEIVNFLGTTQTFTKQLLDQIAEPVRERQGKRVSYVLKPEYTGGT